MWFGLVFAFWRVQRRDCVFVKVVLVFNERGEWGIGLCWKCRGRKRCCQFIPLAPEQRLFIWEECSLGSWPMSFLHYMCDHMCVCVCVCCSPYSLRIHPGKGLIWAVKTILKNVFLAIQSFLLSSFFSPTLFLSARPSAPGSFIGGVVKWCVCSVPLTCVMRAIKTQWNRWVSRDTEKGRN